MMRGKVCPPRWTLVIETLLLLLWVGAVVAVYYFMTPTHQGFFCHDTTIQLPYRHNTISGNLIIIVTLAVPLFVMVLVELISSCRHAGLRQRASGATARPSRWAVAGAYVSYFLGFQVQTLVVVMLKRTTGQLRPHFLAVCQPDVDLHHCQGYVADYNCTNTEMSEKDLLTARESFPSGHASYAFYMALSVMLYVEARQQLRQLPLAKLTFYAMLTSLALWVSATRVQDNMHHPADVIAGGLLGVVVALATFYRSTLQCLRNNNNTNNSSANDIEAGTSGNINDKNNNDDHDDDDDDPAVEEDDHLGNLEAETPSTPTPLLFNGVGFSSNTGLRLGAFKLEGDKRKFSRRATLQ